MEMLLYSESNKHFYVVNENSNKDSTMDATRHSGQDGKMTPALQGGKAKKSSCKCAASFLLVQTLLLSIGLAALWWFFIRGQPESEIDADLLKGKYKNQTSEKQQWENELNRLRDLLKTHQINFSKEREELETRVHNLTEEKKNLQNQYNNLLSERCQLENNLHICHVNLTNQADHLQTSYNNLANARDRLQTDYNNLVNERSQLQTNYSNLVKESDQLRTNYDSLITEKTQLQTSNNNQTLAKYQLQTNYNNLVKEREQLRTNYNNLATGKTQLQTNYNNVVKERDQLRTNYNSLNTRNQQVEQQQAALTRQKNNLQVSLNQVSQEKNQLQRRAEELTKEKNDLQRTIQGKETTLRDLTLQFTTLKNTVTTFGGQYRWSFFSGSFYYLSASKTTWQQSRTFCTSKGADLIIINSKEEQDFANQFKKAAWIGATDSEREGRWKWVDGTYLSRSYWIPREPNGAGRENCLELKNYNSLSSWNDESCTSSRYWICEKRLFE